MRHKSELYKNQRIDLSNQIIAILRLDKHNQIILYNLDNDKEKQDKILALIPELRKYFTFCHIKGIANPEAQKRP